MSHMVRQVINSAAISLYRAGAIAGYIVKPVHRQHFLESMGTTRRRRLMERCWNFLLIKSTHWNTNRWSKQKTAVLHYHLSRINRRTRSIYHKGWKSQTHLKCDGVPSSIPHHSISIFKSSNHRAIHNRNKFVKFPCSTMNQLSF